MVNNDWVIIYIILSCVYMCLKFMVRAETLNPIVEQFNRKKKQIQLEEWLVLYFGKFENSY